MAVKFGFQQGARVVMSMGATSVDVAEYGVAPQLTEFTASGARMNLIDAPIDPQSVSAGRAVARADGKTFFDARSLLDAQTVTAETITGDPVVINVAAAQQKKGHVSGDFYYLPVGGDNRFICEPGQRHRKWHLTKAPTGLTKAQVAANAGVAEGVVTAAWLLDRLQYGGTEATAIHADHFYPMLRDYLGGDAILGRSDHWMLERGYDYTNLVWAWLRGEDERHPLKIGAWGTGADPVVRFVDNYLHLHYAVVQDVKSAREGVKAMYGFSVIFDHINVGITIDVDNNSFVTIRECKALNAWWATPNQTEVNGNGDTVWTPQGRNYISCIFGGYSDYILIDGFQGDHAGWGEGYDPGGSPLQPQPPTMFSHNIYLSANVVDAEIRDSLLTRASACGTQLRGGVRLSGNWFIDNNILSNSQSQTGNLHFVNCLDNIGFGAGSKHANSSIGEKAGGFHWSGLQTSAKGNVIAHHANPEDEAEKTARPGAQVPAVQVGSTPVINDTRVRNWGGSNVNITGLDTAVLDLTTAQRAAGMLMGQATATVPQLVSHVFGVDSVAGEVRKARKWVRSRFGFSEPTRTTPANLVFTPDVSLDGFRWDNHYNWNTDDLPGTHVADSADLAGHFVRFGAATSDIASLKTGGGTLDASSGRLKIGSLLDAAKVSVRRAGQVWIANAAHRLSVDAMCGRVALTGTTANLDLYALGHAEALLGPNCTVQSDSAMVLNGPEVRVGWDGTGTAALTIAGKLEFRRGLILTVSNTSMTRIRHVYCQIGKTVTGSVSGFKGKISGVDRTDRRGGNYRVYVTDLTGTPVAGDVFEIAPARGTDPDVIQTLTVASVVSASLPQLRRFRSGAIGTGLVEPTVTATVTLASTAQVVVSQTGLAAGTYDLTGPGVTVVNQGATLPAGVSVTGGKLVLAVA